MGIPLPMLLMIFVIVFVICLALKKPEKPRLLSDDETFDETTARVKKGMDKWLKEVKERLNEEEKL